MFAGGSTAYLVETVPLEVADARNVLLADKLRSIMALSAAGRGEVFAIGYP